MEFKKLISERQSCRNFSDKAVSTEDIIACMEAARLAPSACNAQPMHYTVCTGENAAKVARYTQGMGMNKFASNVPCFIVISEDDYNATAAAGSKFKKQDYRSIDIGIAADHIVLCAASLGLSTCILGWFDEKKLQEMLKTDRHIRLIIALGYAAPEDSLRPKKRKNLTDLVDFR